MKRILFLALLTPLPAAGQEPAPREPVRSLDLSADGRLFDQWFQRFGHQPVCHLSHLRERMASITAFGAT